MPALFYNIVGFLGPLFLMIAYLQLSLGKWHGGMMAPHLVNLAGAVALIISLIGFWNLPMFVLESCWAAVSLYGIWRARARN